MLCLSWTLLDPFLFFCSLKKSVLVNTKSYKLRTTICIKRIFKYKLKYVRANYVTSALIVVNYKNLKHFLTYFEHKIEHKIVRK